MFELPVSLLPSSCSWRKALTVLAVVALTSIAGSRPATAQSFADDPAAPPDVAAVPEDAERTASGLATRVLDSGSGDVHPGPEDLAVVEYTGWTADGKAFDSTARRGKPSTLPVDGVISGWSEGLRLMVVGEKRRMWIPSELAYAGQEGRPQGMLVFDVELVELIDIPDAPDDVAAPPADAEVTKSGLASKVLKTGEGERPAKGSRVQVHYTGWTTDGAMFDSSQRRMRPAWFKLTEVIKGWGEGIQLMQVGEKRRFWIPEKLAYKGKKGKPEGMLVFDIELLDFNRK